MQSIFILVAMGKGRRRYFLHSRSVNCQTIIFYVSVMISKHTIAIQIDNVNRRLWHFAVSRDSVYLISIGLRGSQSQIQKREARDIAFRSRTSDIYLFIFF